MYKHTKHSPGISQRGQFIGDAAAHRFISAHHHRAYKLNDAAKRNKTLDDLYADLRANGYYYELVYDAGHGRRYVAFVFRASLDADMDKRVQENQGARRMCFDFQCAPENTYYQQHDA